MEHNKIKFDCNKQLIRYFVILDRNVKKLLRFLQIKASGFSLGFLVLEIKKGYNNLGLACWT
jgi:hypothetical protein